MDPKPNRRRTYLLDPEFQYGLIRRMSIVAVLIILMSLAFLVAVNHFYGNVQIKVAQPDPFGLTGSVVSLPARVSLIKLLWPVMAICVAATLAVTFFCGIIISHRMAGPIYRIRVRLNQMVEGDLRDEIHLRRKDEFKPLAEAVNILMKSWRLQIVELKGLCGRLEIGDQDDQKRQLERINHILASFKTE